jgi:hypothetical protein
VSTAEDRDEMRAVGTTTFTPGDGAALWLGTDAYPMTVRKVSPSGKVVWASRDDFRAARGNTYAVAEKVGLHIPRDVPPTEWVKFTLRADGRYRPAGHAGGSLAKGRTYRQDPCL